MHARNGPAILSPLVALSRSHPERGSNNIMTHFLLNRTRRIAAQMGSRADGGRKTPTERDFQTGSTTRARANFHQARSSLRSRIEVLNSKPDFDQRLGMGRLRTPGQTFRGLPQSCTTQGALRAFLPRVWSYFGNTQPRGPRQTLSPHPKLTRTSGLHEHPAGPRFLQPCFPGSRCGLESAAGTGIPFTGFHWS